MRSKDRVQILYYDKKAAGLFLFFDDAHVLIKNEKKKYLRKDQICLNS
jgi:hypothetical protein